MSRWKKIVFLFFMKISDFSNTNPTMLLLALKTLSPLDSDIIYEQPLIMHLNIKVHTFELHMKFDKKKPFEGRKEEKEVCDHTRLHCIKLEINNSVVKKHHKLNMLITNISFWSFTSLVSDVWDDEEEIILQIANCSDMLSCVGH